MQSWSQSPIPLPRWGNHESNAAEPNRAEDRSKLTFLAQLQLELETPEPRDSASDAAGLAGTLNRATGGETRGRRGDREWEQQELNMGWRWCNLLGFRIAHHSLFCFTSCSNRIRPGPIPTTDQSNSIQSNPIQRSNSNNKKKKSDSERPKPRRARAT